MPDPELLRRYIDTVQQQIAELRERARHGASTVRPEELEAALERIAASMHALPARVCGDGSPGDGSRSGAPEPAVERERYRELFRFAPEAYLVTDAAGVIQEANAAAARLLEVRIDRLRGRALETLVRGGGSRDFRGELRRLARSGRRRSWELEMERPGGRVCPVGCTVVAIRSGEDRLASLHWIIRDLSARRAEAARERTLVEEHAARRAAEAARAQIESVLTHLPIGVLIAEAPGGRMLTYNRPVEEIFGFPPPLADSVAEYSSTYLGLHPDGRPYEDEEWPMARAIRKGEVVTGEEIEFIRPDNSRRICLVSAAPVRDAEGRTVAGVVTFSDVTEERRRTMADRFLSEIGDALSTSLDYQTTVQHLAELCTSLLADYCIVHVLENGRARGLGVAHTDRSREGAVRQILRSFPLESDPDHPVMVALRTGEPQLIPHISEELSRRLAPSAEQQRLVRDLGLTSALVVPLRASGNVLGTISLARVGRSRPFGEEDRELAEEVAARAAHAVDNARLYRNARNAARARDEILGVVSHDLRNALNAALMNTDLLLEIAPVFEAGSKERRQMEAVRRSLDHMHRLVQDLLEVDRLERGRLSIQPVRLLPAALAQEVEELFRPVAQEAGQRLEVDIPDSLPPVRADHARLVQVLSNLVSNAMRHTPRDGWVRVGAEPHAAGVRFLVADSGSGIPPEDLARVFDRFYQAGEPGRGGGGGSGLGLTIARGLVEAQGGRMGVESQPGQGSVFWFTLPRAPEDGA